MIPSETDPRLGALVCEYGTKTPWRIRFAVFFGAPLILACSIGLIVAIVVAPPRDGGDLAGALVLVGLLLGIDVLLVATWLRKRSLRVSLHEHGVRAVDRRETRVFLWSEIDGFSYQAIRYRVNGIPAGTNVSVVVRAARGDRLKISHWLDGAEALATAIDRATYARRRELALRAFDAGLPVTFGRLVVDRSGARVGSAALPWAELKRVERDGGWVRILKKKKLLPWKSLGALHVENAGIFVEIANRNLAGN